MAMAEPRKAPSPAVPVAPARALTPASESGDPVVHKLLGDRQSHMLYAYPDPGAEVAQAQERAAIAEIDAELARMGYSAS